MFHGLLKGEGCEREEEIERPTAAIDAMALESEEPMTTSQIFAFMAEGGDGREGEFEDSFEHDLYLKALKDLELKCKQDLYDKSCPDCLLAKGALRPHKRLDPENTTKAVLSLDLTGPHVQSVEGFKYAECTL